MQNFEIIILVFAILIALLAIADRINLPSPLLLVVAGLIIGFIPFLPSVVLNPEVVFLLFLPPILYDVSTRTSWHDFKSEIVPISALAVALVFLTMITIALTCHFFIPAIGWPLGLVLGAIISPPDAVAATSIIKGLGLNKRIITILEGESLVNDASALIAYRFALLSLGTGSFFLWRASIDFVLVSVGGIIAGIFIGYPIIMVHSRILNNSIISTSLTLLTPFISYLLAERLHTSGILAVVSTGLIVSWKAPEAFSYQTRIRNRAVWDTVIFLLNGFIFILIGLQLPLVLSAIGKYGTGTLILYGILISATTIVVRILWVFGAAYLPFTKKQNGTWKSVLIVAWTGTRGVVSLATALALPLTLNDGSNFSMRSLILFLTFFIIFITLVVQGFSLPLLVKLLGVKASPEYTDEERNLRLFMANSVLDFIDHEFALPLNEQSKIRIKNRYIEIANILSRESEPGLQPLKEERDISSTTQFITTQNAINKFQRTLLISFHKEGLYNQAIIRLLEQELDHEELLLNKMSKKNKASLKNMK